MADPANKVEANGTSALDRQPDFELHLALEVRSRKFGFAVLHGSRLVDWGIREYAAGGAGAKVALNRVLTLVSLYTPLVVIARRTRRASGDSSKNARLVLHNIKTGLARRSVRFTILDRRDLRRFFAELGCKTKHGTASWLAERFDELKWRLPRRRKAWDREEYIVPVLDAMATAVAYSGTLMAPEPNHAN
jgi:hypothetical protein